MVETPEPFNIYSHRIDVRGIVGAIRRVASELQIDGPEDDWTQLTVIGPKKTLGKQSRLRISHDSQFYDGDGWSGHVLGLANYIAEFSQVPRHAEILRVVQSFRFILAFPDVDLNVAGEDERVAWVHEICRHLDGIIFTPSMLLDATGKLLTSVHGRFDPGAVLPAVPPWEDHPDAGDLGEVCESDGEAKPPAAERVARRAIVLAAVGNRGLIENERHAVEEPDQTCQAICAWIQNSGVADEVEPEEWKVLQRRCGSLDSLATINAVWRLEGLGVLLWALGVYELPPYDQLVKPAELLDVVGLFDSDAARGIISVARLRPAEELAAYRNHATMAHWRFRNFSLRPTPLDFVAASQGCWIGTFDITRFRIRRNDVMVGRREIATADPEKVQMCHSLAQERHLAINWIMGDSHLYSHTDTST